MGNVVETDYTVRDTLGFNDTDPTDLGGIIAVSTAACLGINTIDVDNSERVAWNNTTLVEMEAELLLSFCLVHEVLVNGVAVINNSISLIFDSSLFLLSDALEMSDVQVSAFNRFLGTILPDVRSKDLTARCENNMSTCMVSS